MIEIFLYELLFITNRMIIAEITILPVGTKTASLSKYVADAIKELKAMNLNPKVTAMGTIFEAKDITTILEGFKRVHEAVFRNAVPRVVSILKIDERRDKEGSIKQKLNSLKKYE